MESDLGNVNKIIEKGQGCQFGVDWLSYHPVFFEARYRFRVVTERFDNLAVMFAQLRWWRRVRNLCLAVIKGKLDGADVRFVMPFNFDYSETKVPRQGV